MSQAPHADRGLLCPFHKKDVSKVCHTCPLWIQVRGKHPQSGHETDTWVCAIAFGPVATMDAARQSHSTSVAIESLRNETNASARTNTALFKAISDAMSVARIAAVQTVDLIEKK